MARSRPQSAAASQRITQRIESLQDWRGETLARIRQLIHAADTEIVEEWKWAKASSPGTPVWSRDGIVCTGEAYKQVVKLTFARGAALADPKQLFNAGLAGSTRRAIDLREGERLDAAAFKALIRAAVAANVARAARPGKPAGTSRTRAATSRTPASASRTAGARSPARKPAVDAAAMARLIADGKVPPHYAVPMSDGHDAVKAWIDLLPEWQADRARRIDAVVTRAVRTLHKAVKWHGVWYGVPGRGWFLAISSLRAHLKLAFFDGTSLRPVPPIALAARPACALDIREADALDEARLATWVKQASLLPGWGKA